ncbi:hypothetical protein S245_034826 [Arachis hypogaea]
MLRQWRLSALHRRRTEAPSHSFPDLLPVLLASLLSNPNLQSANLAKVWRLDFQFHAINFSYSNRSSLSHSLRSFSSSAAASAAIVRSFAHYLAPQQPPLEPHVFGFQYLLWKLAASVGPEGG